MYPSAAKPAAITRRRITAHALRLMKPWLMANKVNPSAMVKYHQAKNRGLSLGVGNSLLGQYIQRLMKIMRHIRRNAR
jgi:hypothetical protein